MHRLLLYRTKNYILFCSCQWYETADTNEVSGAVHEGDHDSHVETTYSYAKDWFDKRINSESFSNPMGHHNPEYWPHNSSVSKIIV